MRCNCETKSQTGSDSSQVLASKDMDGFPQNFLPIFIRNQFLTTIELPTGATWPTAEGKTAIVTGANSGLGLDAARQLLGLGLSNLIIAVRSIEKGNAALAKLQPVNPEAKIRVWQLDMESYASIQAFAKRCEQELDRIDVAILNAGVSLKNFSKTESTGHEKTIQVNHIGTALLAILLLPVLKSKAAAQPKGVQPPHLTVVNSAMAHLCKVPNKDARPFLPSFDDTEITPYDEQERYGVSKLLSQLFIVKLAEYVSADDVIVNMVDPGLTKGTGLFDVPGIIGIIGKGAMSIVGRPVERGAATYVDAVLRQGKASHGSVLMNCRTAP